MVPEVQDLAGFRLPGTGIAGDNLLSKEKIILRESRKLSAFSNPPLVWVGRGGLCTGLMNLQFCFLPPKNTVTKRVMKSEHKRKCTFLGKKGYRQSFIVSTEVFSWV